MLQRIKGFFDLSRYEDEEERFTALVLQTTVLAILPAWLIILAIMLITEGRLQLLWSMGLSIVIFLLCWWAVRRGRVRLASVLLPLWALVMTVCFAFVGRGVNDVSTISLLTVIVMASLLLGKNAPLIFWFLSVLAMAALDIGQINGLVAVPIDSVPGQAIIWATITGLAAMLLRVMVGHLVSGRQRARDAEKMLRELNEELEQRVEQRTHDLRIAKDEAEAARGRAEQADRIKSQFLASMSHELRTPLNAILNFTEMTAMGMLGPVNSQQEDVLVKSLDSGKHLLALINDVLDVSKMQSGMLTLFIEEKVDLHAELQPVIDTAKTLLKGKPVRFITDIDENLPAIRGDKRRVRQILLNLISNAAKFTEEGSITLSAKARADEVLFAVIDTGPGIAADEQRIIFEPFQQTEAGIKHMGGTGLGLPISKHLAEAHGGRIWLESEPGDGSAFYVVLPVAAAS